jgi:hypothetical protein
MAMASSDPVATVVVGMSELIGIVCALRLWRRPSVSLWSKVGWTAVLALPVIGPLAFGALAGGGPSIQHDDLQARETDADDADP